MPPRCHGLDGVFAARALSHVNEAWVSLGKRKGLAAVRPLTPRRPSAPRCGYGLARPGQPLLTRNIYDMVRGRAQELLGVKFSPQGSASPAAQSCRSTPAPMAPRRGRGRPSTPASGRRDSGLGASSGNARSASSWRRTCGGTRLPSWRHGVLGLHSPLVPSRGVHYMSFQTFRIVSPVTREIKKALTERAAPTAPAA